jgi:putative membrane protein insertion efficiency factor
MKKVIIKIIEIYQKTLSPDHGWFRRGGFCKYQPSCSEYCKGAVEKYGVLKGLAKAGWRLLRCNPWSSGGSDPV